MNKLEVGMYYRYKEAIGKYIKPDLGPSYFTNQNKYGWHEIANGGKFSHNIINLIEVGDYVNGEKITRIIPQDICGYEVLDYQHILINDREIFKEDIKSIVTKEMFEQMKYEVE